MIKLTPEVRERIRRFIKALESGKYKQTTEQLRSGERRCCLGVACDVFHEDTGMGEWIINVDGIFEFLGESGELPVEVQNYFGGVTAPWELHTTLILADLNDEEKATLADLNDEQKATFPEIAKILREEYGIYD